MAYLLPLVAFYKTCSFGYFFFTFCAISDIKHDIEELEKRGATHITIDHGIYYESSYVTIEPICRRLETDEEYAKRLKNQESLNKQRIERELKQLNELRLKYGV